MRMPLSICSISAFLLVGGSSDAQQPESIYPAHCKQNLQNWEPYPDKSDLMVFTAHPDDEGIFFGGALPYYTQVKNKSTILIGMVGFTNPANYDRVEELERAAWHYGVRHQPVNFRYSLETGNRLQDMTSQEDLRLVAERVATEIRRYKPDVLLTHDFNGEYGHIEHQVTADAVAMAYDIAADPTVPLEGLQPWQSQKLYIHRYNHPGGSDPVPSPTVNPSTGYIYHSWEETFPELGGKSSREIAIEGCQCHQDAIKVWPDLQVSSRHVVGEQFDGHHSEDWGLYRSEVGPDSIDSDFFQNVEALFYPTLFGDLTNDQTISIADWLHFKDFAGDELASMTREERYYRGDLDFDGDNDLIDFSIFRDLYNAKFGADAFAEISTTVPEPTGICLLSQLATVAIAFVHLSTKRTKQPYTKT